MAVLLSKFRIDYSDLVIISDIDETPKLRTKKWFNGIIQPFLQPNANGVYNVTALVIFVLYRFFKLTNTAGPHITKEEFESFQYKTNRHLKLRELLLDHSSDSNLVVM
jgi:solute carrier family 12 sodium/potassium/chloride transporter 2